MRLDSTDLLALNAAVADLYRPEPVESFPSTAIRVTSGLVRSRITSFNEVDPTRGRAVAIWEPAERVFFPGAIDRFAELQGEHPVIRYVAATGDGSARKITDFVDQASFRESRIYRELYSLMGVDYQMAISLPAVQPRIVAIALNRSGDDQDFDDRDRLVLNLLRPHIAQAYENAHMRGPDQRSPFRRRKDPATARLVGDRSRWGRIRGHAGCDGAAVSLLRSTRAAR